MNEWCEFAIMLTFQLLLATQRGKCPFDKLSLISTLEVIEMTNFSAASNAIFLQVTTYPFQCSYVRLSIIQAI